MVDVQFQESQHDDVYSESVRIGSLIMLSGQGGWNDRNEFPDLLIDEIKQAFENVGRALTNAGVGWHDVVSVMSYHVDLAGHQDEMNRVMGNLFKAYMPTHKPIWTNNGVTALGDARMRVEIKVIAVDRGGMIVK